MKINKEIPLFIDLEGEPEELRFAGDRLDVVFILLLGLDPEPPVDREVSVLSLLLFVVRVLVTFVEAGVLATVLPGWWWWWWWWWWCTADILFSAPWLLCSPPAVIAPSPSLESSLESPVNGIDRIWLARCNRPTSITCMFIPLIHNTLWSILFTALQQVKLSMRKYSFLHMTWTHNHSNQDCVWNITKSKWCSVKANGLCEVFLGKESFTKSCCHGLQCQKNYSLHKLLFFF